MVIAGAVTAVHGVLVRWLRAWARFKRVRRTSFLWDYQVEQ